MEGKKTREQLVTEFLTSFDIVNQEAGSISYKEWVDYYTDLAMSIPNDEYFVNILQDAWRVTEDELNNVFVDKVSTLIGMMRQRILVLSNNCEEEFLLRKIFKGFDLNNSGTITIDELAAMLAKIGINVEKKYI